MLRLFNSSQKNFGGYGYGLDQTCPSIQNRYPINIQLHNNHVIDIFRILGMDSWKPIITEVPSQKINRSIFETHCFTDRNTDENKTWHPSKYLETTQFSWGEGGGG